MDALKEFRDAIATLDEVSLRQRPPEYEQIGLARSVADSFWRMSDAERREAQLAMATSSRGKKLMTLSAYLAETAINRQNSDLIKTSISLHVVEGFQSDYRENIRHLVLIAHAAHKIGVEISEIISSVSAAASPVARKRLEEFTERKDDLNTLRVVGVKEDNASGRFRFVPE